MSYRIPKQPEKYLEVYVGEAKRPKRVPLMSCLPAPWLLKSNAIRKLPEDERGMGWFEFAYDLFHAYLGKDAELLTAEQLNELFAAWNDANEDTDGAEAGE